MTGLNLGLASEGAYGPHPQIPFLALGLETAILLDAATQTEVRETVTDETPTYGRFETGGTQDLDTFLRRVDFPAQGLILSWGAPEPGRMIKGLRDPAVLRAELGSAEAGAVLETDMRAHMNPRRMETLRRLATRLADRLCCTCPLCEAPGFGRTGVETGLPCGCCGTATGLVVSELWSCPACAHSERRGRADGTTRADPGTCPLCNP